MPVTFKRLEDKMVTRFRNFFGFILFFFAGSTVWGAPHHVDIRDFFFSPATVTIIAGDTVQWEVIEECCLQHTVTRTSSPNTWNSGPLALEQTYTRAFPNAGTFSYFCSPHQGIGMTGSIIVKPNPSLTNIPVMGWLGLLLLGLTLMAAGIYVLERKRKTA